MSDHDEPLATFEPREFAGLAARLSNWNMGPRRRKETLLPRITQLALEGHSSEAIAGRVGMPSRTVRHWLQALRQEWIAAAKEDTSEMLAVAMARLNAIYREAMEEWREAPRESEMRLNQEIRVSDGSRATVSKKSVRTQSQKRNTAILTRAIAAAKAAFDLRLRAAASQALLGPASRPIPLESITEQDLRNMSNEELAALEKEVEARIAAEAAEESTPATKGPGVISPEGTKMPLRGTEVSTPAAKGPCPLPTP